MSDADAANVRAEPLSRNTSNFLQQRARYKRQRWKTREEERERKRERERGREERQDCRICFCRQPGSDRFLIYFPWDHAKRTNYYSWRGERGDGPSGAALTDVHIFFILSCRVNGLHVT